MKISVITGDKYLAMQAELMLSESADLCFSADDGADITLLDIDTAEKKDLPYGKLIRLSRREGEGDITLPLPYSFYSSLISSAGDSARLSMSKNKKECSLDGRTIKLTSHEYSLLFLLYSRGGDYAGREEISKTVFGGGGDNMINLYIHYLREKLESGSEKIILSSRKLGYAINADFLGGKIC